MRAAPLFVILICLSVTALGQEFYGTTNVKTFRNGRDAEFRNKDKSPLKEEDFGTFKGLNYYAINKSLRVSADFTRTADEKYFDIPTSSGKTKSYVKYGILKFRLGGKRYRLSVYQPDKATLEKFPEYADLLFLPFRDSTGRTETYAGGRYIYIRQPKGKRVELDFNLAFNPSCAYGSGRYNCPIPPSENTLAAAIKAGEKRFAYFESKTATVK